MGYLIKKLKLRNSAFSILEISIVLLVLSLLVLIFISYKNIRNNSAARMSIKDFSQIQVAFNLFYDSYDAIAGDYNLASQTWEEDCLSLTVSCDGDGDSIIELYNESFLVWYHMKLANVFPGNFTGEGDGNNQFHVADINVPKAPFLNSQYSLFHYHLPQFPDQHLILLGAKAQDDYGKTSILEPDYAFHIDEKIDDGKPSKGKVFGRNGWYEGSWDNTNCIINSLGIREPNSENIDSDIKYNLDQKGVECILGVNMGFVGANDTKRVNVD